MTAPGSVRIDVLRSLAALQAYEAPWNKLAFDSPQRWPALSYAWIVSHLESALAPGEGWCCVVATDNEELVGVLPAVIEPYTVLGLDRPRLGMPRRWDTYMVDILVAHGRKKELLPLLLERLRREYPKLFHISLPELPELSPTLAMARNRLGHFAVCRQFSTANAHLEVKRSFHEYYATLDGYLRKNLARRRKQLNELPAVKTVFLRGQEAARRGLEGYVELEAAGWKGKKGLAIQSIPALGRFHERLGRRLGELGWLECGLLMAGEHLLAADVAVKMNGKLVALKTTYDEAFSRYSPGKLLLIDRLERAFASGDIDDIDFGSDANWLENWEMQWRSYYDLWLYPHRWLSLTRGLLVKRAAGALRRLPRWLPFHRFLPARPSMNT